MRLDQIKNLILLLLSIIGTAGGCVIVSNSTDVTIDQNKQDEPVIDLSIFKKAIKSDSLKLDSLKNK